MSDPEVSVVLPVYNSQEYLRDAVVSILEQTLGNFELIIIDDGSEDGSLEIAMDYAENDSRIIIISRDHSGLVAALNAGLAAARAPLVARMDADDISLPDRLAKQAGVLNLRPEVDLCGCRVKSFPAGSVGEGMLYYEQWLNDVVSGDEIMRDLFVESPFAHPSVLYRRDVVMEAGGYVDNGWPEDYDLWMRLFLNGSQFAKVPEELFLWRDTPGRMSRTDAVYAIPRFRKLKLNYLIRSYLRDRSGVTLWGAGRDGRWWCRELEICGKKVERFIDVDPAKTGRNIGGAPILPPDALKRKTDGDFILGVVGTRGARERIREYLLDASYVELKDFLFLT
ncbi:MAG TPA: glycosyltransferase [bacterium]|nr:glycosyltransferase [bacterium]